MSNLLRVEYYKLMRNKVFWTLIIISALISFLLISIFYMAEQGTLEKIQEFNDNISVEKIEADPEEVEVPNSGIYLFMSTIISSDTFFINILFICIIGAFFITSEYSTGTIKNLVSVGYSRSKIYVSKLVIYSITSLLLTLSFAVFFGIFGTIYFGFGELPREDVIRLVKVLLLICLYVISFVSIAMFFVIMARGTGMALLLSFGFYLVIGSSLKFLSYQFTLFEKISNYSVYSLYTQIGGSDLSSKDLFQFINVPIITIIIFVIIGISYFKRQDIAS